jgi:hypothetical protein
MESPKKYSLGAHPFQPFHWKDWRSTHSVGHTGTICTFISKGIALGWWL